MSSELPEAACGRVELTVRQNPRGRFLFLVNRTDDEVPVPGLDGELLTGTAGADGTLLLRPRDVAVLRQPHG